MSMVDPPKAAGAARRIQRRLNLLSVLEALLTEPSTISDVAARVGLSRPATESVVADLSELGWLSQVEPDGRMGRPATRWVLRPDSLNVVGLDIGAHHVTAIVADVSGRVRAEVTHQLDAELDGPERLRQSLAAAREAVFAAGLGPEQVALTGVAAPGIVHEGVVTYFGGDHMPGWAGTDIATTIRRELGLKAVVAGDCALGALGESWQGAASGHGDVVYLMSGTRTGAAAIIGGRVHQGHRGSAGLIGELRELRWREIEEETFGAEVYTTGRPERAEIFDRARRGDARAREVVDDYAEVLALGACALVLALGPSHLVIGGHYSSYGDVFLDQFIAAIQRRCPLPPEVSISALGERAIALGAVRHALDNVSDTIRDAVMNTNVFPSPASLRATVTETTN